MTLQQLNQIIAIADTGSINEAARKLYVSQPNLSAALRDIEEKLGFTLFIRSNRGIRLTPEGEDFVAYARQVAAQYQVLENRFLDHGARKKFSVSLQHYSFGVKAFIETVKRVGMERYEFAVHETQTQTVIDNVHNLKSELGVLYLSDFNEKALLNIFQKKNLEFHELFQCDTYVYLWKNHPLADKKTISLEELRDYPCLAFEQGAGVSFYYAEEMMSTYEYDKLIRADDRATMLNLMVGLGAYTLCSGNISEELNGNDYLAIPLAESEKIRIGYIQNRGTVLSEIGRIYIEELRNSVL